MNIQEYIEHLKELAGKFPQAEIIYASDSEGNSFHKAYFNPSAGLYKDGDFLQLDHFNDPNYDEDFNDYDPHFDIEKPKIKTESDVNAICIN